MTSPEPFGAYAPTGLQNQLRSWAGGMPDNWIGKRLAMVLRRFAGAKAGRPFDITLFDTQKVRIHPYDNVSEKRVFATPQFWDAAEREALGNAIANTKDETFYFADIGANAGLYSLHAFSAAKKAGKTLRVLALEPAPTMLERLRFNLDASGDADHVVLLPWAATAEAGEVTFTEDTANRGENKIGVSGDGFTVMARPLLDAIQEAGFPRVDAMKIDIEGFERPALEALFATAPRELWPRMLVMETMHDQGDDSALALCLAHDYQVTLETKLNGILILD